jgi:hypothetical protein
MIATYKIEKQEDNIIITLFMDTAGMNFKRNPGIIIIDIKSFYELETLSAKSQLKDKWDCFVFLCKSRKIISELSKTVKFMKRHI